MICCGIKHVFSICLCFFHLSEVMADSRKGKRSKTKDCTGGNVDDVECLNVSFSEMELGKNLYLHNLQKKRTCKL